MPCETSRVDIGIRVQFYSRYPETTKRTCVHVVKDVLTCCESQRDGGDNRVKTPEKDNGSATSSCAHACRRVSAFICLSRDKEQSSDC